MGGKRDHGLICTRQQPDEYAFGESHIIKSVYLYNCRQTFIMATYVELETSHHFPCSLASLAIRCNIKIKIKIKISNPDVVVLRSGVCFMIMVLFSHRFHNCRSSTSTGAAGRACLLSRIDGCYCQHHHRNACHSTKRLATPGYHLAAPDKSVAALAFFFHTVTHFIFHVVGPLRC